MLVSIPFSVVTSIQPKNGIVHLSHIVPPVKHDRSDIYHPTKRADDFISGEYRFLYTLSEAFTYPDTDLSEIIENEE